MIEHGWRWMLVSLLLSSPAAWGQSIGWRGDGTGCFPAAETPVEWDIDENTNILWQTEIGNGQSSPVVVDGKIYYVSRDKGAYVLPAKPEFEQLAHNVIADDTSIFNGSPVVSNGQLLLRSDKFLYCIDD